MEYFAAEFKRKNDNLDLTQSARAMTRLRHNSEKAKVVLSAAPTAPIEIDAVYEGVDLFSSISRAKFEGLLKDHLIKLQAALDRALANAGVEKDDVQSLIISGGCGKIPKIRETVQRYFGHKTKLLTGVQSVDECVAFGCAIQASIIVTATADAAVSDVREVKLSTLSIGVENAAGELQVVIPKHTPLPVLKSVHTTVNHLSKGGFLQLYEGEILKAAAKNHKLATMALPKLEGTADMTFEISMDVNANISLQIIHSASRTRVQLEVPAVGGKQLSDVEISKALEAGHAEHKELLAANQVLRAQVDALEDRGAEIKRAVSAPACGDALTEADRRIMGKAVDDVANWLATISIGPIIHAKAADIEKKGKGLEIIYGGFAKKIEAAKNAPAPVVAASSAPAPKKAAPAPTPAPAPMHVMDTGDLD